MDMSALNRTESGQKLLNQAKAITDSLKSRRQEINEMVCRTFWKVKHYNRRGPATMAKAYQTAEELAQIGGEDYAEAVKVLRFALTGPEAYKEACDVLLVDVRD